MILFYFCIEIFLYQVLLFFIACGKSTFKLSNQEFLSAEPFLFSLELTLFLCHFQGISNQNILH